VLAQVIAAEIKSAKQRRVVLDGMRHPAEFEVLKKLPGFLLVYLTAPLELRYRRARSRGEKAGERNFTLQEFKREEALPTEAFIRSLGRKAKVKLTNAGSLPDLYRQIEERIVKPYL
jgi:dephospho-CoA kinase